MFANANACISSTQTQVFDSLDSYLGYYSGILLKYERSHNPGRLAEPHSFIDSFYKFMRLPSSYLHILECTIFVNKLFLLDKCLCIQGYIQSMFVGAFRKWLPVNKVWPVTNIFAQKSKWKRNLALFSQFFFAFLEK